MCMLFAGQRFWHKNAEMSLKHLSQRDTVIISKSKGPMINRLAERVVRFRKH